MKYVKIIVDTFKIKADMEDPETMTADVYDKLAAMLEAETLTFVVDEEESEDDEFEC